MFHGKMFLKSRLQLLLLDFVGGPMLELMYIPFNIISAQASFVFMVPAASTAAIIHRNHYFHLFVTAG